MTAPAKSKLPKGQTCPIGPLRLHTMNFEQTQCIWCGPDGLAWKPGRWVSVGEDAVAWSAEEGT